MAKGIRSSDLKLSRGKGVTYENEHQSCSYRYSPDDGHDPVLSANDGRPKVWER